MDTLRQLQVQLTRTRAFMIDNQPVVELAFMLGLYIRVWGASFRYLLSMKKTKAAGYPYRCLVIHILVSFIIVGRYYILQLFSTPIPGRLDKALGLAQVISSLYLAKHTPNTDTLFKAGFQVMGVMNLMAIITVFVTGSPRWHRVLVKCVDWFIYFRWLLRAILKYRILGYPKVPYTTLVQFVSPPITLWIAGYPAGTPIYFATLVCVMSLNQWVSTQVPHE